jgi:hypothetical protein
MSSSALALGQAGYAQAVRALLEEYGCVDQ